MQIIAMIFPMVFTTNLLMTIVKYLAGAAATTTWLRVALLVISIGGAFSISAITGNPIDVNQISDWGKLLVEALTIAITAHGSYKAISYKVTV